MVSNIGCFGHSPCFGLIEPALTFGQFCWILLAIGVGLFVLPRMLKNKLHDPVAQYGRKHLWMQAIRFRGTFFNLGLVISIGIAALVLNIVERDLMAVSIITLPGEPDWNEPEMPGTDYKKPMPLPSPPPPKLAITEDVAEPPIFEDKSILPDSSAEHSTTLDITLPTQPPPPPPPYIEISHEPPFRAVEQMPRFPGCENLAGANAEKQACASQKLLEFIYKNIKYPVLARENGIQGTVVVSFVVEKDGQLTDVVVIRDIGGGCGTEVLRVVNLINEKGLRWMPGKQRGRPVRVQFNLPVKYKLN